MTRDEQLALLRGTRRLTVAADGGDEAVVGSDEARALVQAVRPAVDAMTEHARAEVDPESLLSPNERVAKLAATMAEVFRQLYDMTDEEMDRITQLALGLIFRAEAGERDATKTVGKAYERLARTMAVIAKARAGKVSH